MPIAFCNDRAGLPLRLLQEGLADGLFPAAAYRIQTAAGEVLSEGALGRLDPDSDRPCTMDTVWDVASLTKPVAAATPILHLVEAGALHLGEEVGRFLPFASPSLEGITLFHCLTHTSGLKAFDDYHSHGWSPEEILVRIGTEERNRRPGAGYEYSDLGYILLGEVAARVAGEPLDRLCERTIFGPLRMDRTGFRPPADPPGGIAPTRCPTRGVLRGEVHDPNAHALGGVAGHAGLFSTAADLCRFGRMVLAGGTLEGGRVLSPLSTARMARNQNPAGLPGHTLGWFTRPNDFFPAGDLFPDGTFGHTGFTGTSLLLVPALELVVVLLTNRVYQERPPAEFLRFRRRFHNAVAAALEAPSAS